MNLIRFLLPIVKLLPAESVDEERVLLQVLLQGRLLYEHVCVLVTDQELLVLQVVDGLIVDAVYWVTVVQGVRRGLLSAK